MPARKPARIKKLQGTMRPDRTFGKTPPGTVTNPPRAPTGLNKHAKRWWRRVVPALMRLGIIDPDADYGRLVLLAQAYGYAQEAADTIRIEGMFRRDENKVQRKHPGIQIWRDATATYNSLSRELGLTPLSRAQLGIEAENAEDDEFQKFLLRRRDTKK